MPEHATWAGDSRWGLDVVRESDGRRAASKERGGHPGLHEVDAAGDEGYRIAGLLARRSSGPPSV